MLLTINSTTFARQCCHSKKIKKNLVGPIKPKITFLCVWVRFLGKIQLFLKKSQLFPPKLAFYPHKFLTTFFSSHQLGPKSITKAQKHYFSVKFENTQEIPSSLEKPKNPRLDRKTQDLGRKPKEWQRWTSKTPKVSNQNQTTPFYGITYRLYRGV